MKKVFFDCLKQQRHAFFIFFLLSAVNLAIFRLYGLPIEPFLYSLSVAAIAGVIIFAIYYMFSLRRARDRERLQSSLPFLPQLPEPESLTEQDYQQMLHIMNHKINLLNEQLRRDHQDISDYLTTWVHQIKTPIAVLHMLTKESDSEEHRAITAELFRIEQYVGMVLQYIRLDCENNDLLIREYSLDELLRSSIRKFAPQFIMRRLSMTYNGTDLRIVTDRKWFCDIIEQLLSNAVKYTRSGGITVEIDTGHRLHIRDTGIGIAADDLPRIFEKGYTGVNGRLDQRASGLGLYLAKRAADKLSIPLSAESTVGQGSCFTLDLHRPQTYA